jgi:hypothetical protein
LQGPRQVIHAVGRYYLDKDGKGAEMAFVTSESKRRLGMSRVLIERMMEIGHQRKLEFLWAQVDSDNTPMLALFRSYDAKESPGEDMQTVRIDIPLENGLILKNKGQRKSFLRFGKRSGTP